MSDVQTARPPPSVPARSKVELLYQEILRESHQLVGSMEALMQRQEEIQQSLHAVPSAIRQAGLAAASQAADQATRSMLEAGRTIAHVTTELRVTGRVAQSAVPAAAWRTGLFCMASAFCGSGLGAMLTFLFCHS
ncbi:hypothetical protein GG851_02545 [Bordetella petrii]|nr:hypothetical protein [Bordetella petrii]